jgi:hypothetical protein
MTSDNFAAAFIAASLLLAIFTIIASFAGGQHVLFVQ